jgi:hypothetical protein
MSFLKLQLHVQSDISKTQAMATVVAITLAPWAGQQLKGPYLLVTFQLSHRDKTRVQMPAKIFPGLLVVYGLHSWFWHKAKEQFFIKFGVFYNKNKILTIFFIVNMRKSHFNDEFLVLLGPIISCFLHVQMRKKINQNNKGCVL